MSSKDIQDRIKKIFEKKSVRQALMISGCVAASLCFGGMSHDFIATLHAGFLEIVKILPLENTTALAEHFFQGSANWFSTVANGAADQMNVFGVDVPAALQENLDQIRRDLGETIVNSKELFKSLLVGSAELGSVWRGVIRDVAPQMITDGFKAVAEMIPTNPYDAAKAFYNLALKAVEGYGLVKAVQESYKWVLGKFRKKELHSAETASQAQSCGLPESTVTNININIALGGTEAADTAANQIKSILDLVDRGDITFNLDFDAPETQPSLAPKAAVNAVADPGDGADGLSIINSEQVAWTSRRINKQLREAVSNRVEGLNVWPKSPIWNDVELIEGGIIYRHNKADFLRSAPMMGGISSAVRTRMEIRAEQDRTQAAPEGAQAQTEQRFEL